MQNRCFTMRNDEKSEKNMVFLRKIIVKTSVLR